jgi:hypothetical protein
MAGHNMAYEPAIERLEIQLTYRATWRQVKLINVSKYFLSSTICGELVVVQAVVPKLTNFICKELSM